MSKTPFEKRQRHYNHNFTSIFRYAPSSNYTEDDDELVEIVEGRGVAFTLSSLSEKPEAEVVREDSITTTLTPNPADVAMPVLPYVPKWIITF